MVTIRKWLTAAVNVHVNSENLLEMPVHDSVISSIDGALSGTCLLGLRICLKEGGPTHAYHEWGTD